MNALDLTVDQILPAFPGARRDDAAVAARALALLIADWYYKISVAETFSHRAAAG